MGQSAKREARSVCSDSEAVAKRQRSEASEMRLCFFHCGRDAPLTQHIHQPSIPPMTTGNWQLTTNQPNLTNHPTSQLSIQPSRVTLHPQPPLTQPLTQP